MATIRKRGNKWQVQVRRKGFTPTSRSFYRKSDAETWARHTEARADRRGLPPNPELLSRLTVAELIERYRDTVTVKKRGRETETGRLNVMLRHRLARIRLADLTPAHFSAYRDERLRTLKPGTIRRELSLLQHVLEVARREWAIPIPDNPVAGIKKPPPDRPRDRRLESEELQRLLL